MTLIKSISGIRGTIGGTVGENLTPVDVVKFTTAFATFLLEKREETNPMRMVVGRDARISGDIVNRLVCSTLHRCDRPRAFYYADHGNGCHPTTCRRRHHHHRQSQPDAVERPETPQQQG